MKKWLLFLIVSNCLNGMGPFGLSFNYRTLTLRMKLAVGLLNPDKPNSHGITPLHCAANIQDSRYLSLLLDHSTQVDKPDSRCGWTPLQYAAFNGNDTYVRLLAKAGASVDRPTNPRSQSTPLHLTTHRLHFKATQSLLDAGANPCATNILQQTPLHETCLSEQPAAPAPSQRVEIVSLLIEHAVRKGMSRDTYVLAEDAKGKTAADYVNDDDQELKDLLLPEVEYNQTQFHKMLTKRGIGAIEFLRNKELGLIR